MFINIKKMFTHQTYYIHPTRSHKDVSKKKKSDMLVSRAEHNSSDVHVFESILTIKRMPKLSEIHNRWAIGQLPNDDYIYISHEVLEEWSSKILHINQKFYVRYTYGTSHRDDTPWAALHIQEFHTMIYDKSKPSTDKLSKGYTDQNLICMNCHCQPTSYCGICKKYTSCICNCITCNKPSSQKGL